ncbi:MAG: sigma-70 family RNA polymerase sigma factor [Bacteroidales bacterium]|jgi:RNA polymerase sigma-70 factor (ECF subfamily)|nr:sigma-70 family RNA polymerase sigma factor [Bacteroidales bacterium]
MNIKDCSDAELIEKYLNGDKNCMEVLIHRYKKKVYTYILITVKNPTVADDLFQDTFMKVISSLKNGVYQDKGKFGSWLIRIAHNITIDYFRFEKNRNLYSQTDEKTDIFNVTSLSDITIEDKVIDNQIESDIRNIIEYLPEEQKEIILLRHYGNMSFKEIADLTGVSINTALGRMRYALINLRKIIEENNIILTR